MRVLYKYVGGVKVINFNTESIFNSELNKGHLLPVSEKPKLYTIFFY